MALQGTGELQPLGWYTEGVRVPQWVGDLEHIERAIGTWCWESHSGHTAGADTCLFFMCLLRKPNIVLAVKGEMLIRCFGAGTAG